MRFAFFSLFNMFPCFLLLLSLMEVYGQYGSQSTGIREAILGINAYCDFTCSNAQTSNWVAQCLQNAYRRNSPITQVLTACTRQLGYGISCNQNALIQLENCVVRMTSYGYQSQSLQTARCLRQVLTSQVTSCLRMRYPRLAKYVNGGGIYTGMGGLGGGTSTTYGTSYGTGYGSGDGYLYTPLYSLSG